jgi:hypothetical protein
MFGMYENVSGCVEKTTISNGELNGRKLNIVIKRYRKCIDITCCI